VCTSTGCILDTTLRQQTAVGAPPAQSLVSWRQQQQSLQQQQQLCTIVTLLHHPLASACRKASELNFQRQIIKSIARLPEMLQSVCG
jgi:hypothetical protein